MTVKFDATTEEIFLVEKIVDRAADLLKAMTSIPQPLDWAQTKVCMQMDLVATHANGCPMDFERLSNADDLNLLHDVLGINAFINRQTGQLGGEFPPRFASKETASE